MYQRYYRGCGAEMENPCPDGMVLTPNGCQPIPGGVEPEPPFPGGVEPEPTSSSSLPGWVLPVAIVGGSALVALVIVAAAR